LATWLHRIAINVCLNRVSVRAPRAEPIDEYEVPDTRSASARDALLAHESGSRIRAAIAKLPPKQRATVILRVYQELSHQEIAEILRSSVGAVKANFFHALANLRRLLQDTP